MNVKTRTAAASAKAAGTNGNGTSTRSGKIGGSAKKLDKKIVLVREWVQNAVRVSFEKAVAHYENPSMYPLPAGSDSVEKAFYDLLSVLSAGKRRKVVEKINETLKATPTKRASLYKDIANVNFKSSVSIAEQIRAMPAPDSLRFTPTEADDLLSRVKKRFETPGKKEAKQSMKNNAVAVAPRGRKVATKLAFVVDSVACVETDDRKKDEISLAGFGFDTNGGNFNVVPFFVGKFKKGESISLGSKGRLFQHEISQKASEQSFSAALFIVEDDLFKNAETVEKLQKLFLAIAVASLLVSAGLLAAAFIAQSLVLLGASIIAGGFFAILKDVLIILPLLGPDISLAVQDDLFVDVKLEIGDEFARAFTLNEAASLDSEYDGDYRIAARWVAEA
ncbi:MAG TPA: hypothetical protein PKD26_09140 [Pyrinomonadaceae bacterium]|nr:hypothetical protein [Pyrinomonadaceae bacterium]